jgi:hypothetical protein
MKLADALNILGVTGDNITLDQCKTAYRKACMKYHPDRNPGGLEMMKAVNMAWEVVQSADWARPVNNQEGKDTDYGDELNNFLNEIINLQGIVIEICGAWVWISGNTRPYKDIIKKAGGMWAPKKMQWYFRPKGWASANKGEWSMDEIRGKFGSTVVKKSSQRLQLED